MSFPNGYLGIPYTDLGDGHDGADCYGLVRLVYRETRGIELPAQGLYAHLDLTGTDGRKGAEALIARVAANWPWRRVDRPAPLDVVIFRRGRIEDHMGLIVDQRRFLHVVEAREACVERLDNPLWCRRVAGYYRHTPPGHPWEQEAA